MARVRLLVEATFAPGSPRDGEIAEWCKHYTTNQTRKLIESFTGHRLVRVRHEGIDYPALIDRIVEVDADEPLKRWEPGPLTPIEWSHTDPEHLS